MRSRAIAARRSRLRRCVSLCSLALLLAARPAPVQGQGPPTSPASPALPSFVTADFSGSGNCAFCHSGLKDQAGADVSIDAHWRVTMMAQSARDPLWQAKVSSEVVRNPALRTAIEGKCATCHTPMARTQALADGQSVSLFDGGFLSASHPLHPAAGDGVSCTACHQIQPDHLRTAESFTGGYVIDTSTVPPSRLVFGPFVAPVQAQMQGNVGFTPVEGAHTRDSALCATCHTLYTPTVDAAGNVVGTLPEQTPYLEWQHSAYGDGAGEDRSCQQCHMPTAAGGVVISNRPGGRQLPQRSPFTQHQFVGANAFMLDLMASHATDLQVTASATQLTASADRTRAHLQAATARVAIAHAARGDEGLEFEVDVRSLVGHKLPTGFPSRRVWLHAVVTDATGRIVFESGRPEADGRIAGSDADERADGIEPHHEVISEASQVQIYEAVMLDTDGAPTYTLLRGARYGKDNRLLPAGFVAATAPADVAVAGEAAHDHDFDGGGDRVRYAVAAREASGPLTVSVRLLYQPVSYRFVADLGSTPTSQVQRFNGLWAGAQRAPAVVAAASATVR